MRRFVPLVASALVALALAACSTGGPGGGQQPPDDTIDVSVTAANNDPTQPVKSVSLGNGDEQVFAVTVSQDVAGFGLLYVELDREVDLEVMTGAYGTVNYSSSSLAYFGSGSEGLGTAAAAGLGPQAVTLSVTCRGSCVILELAAGGTFYVRVTNPGPSTNVSLYVYGDDYGDEYEPENDTLQGAPTFQFFDSGAIETVGDVDYWYFEAPTTVTFDTNDLAIPLEAWILDAAGNLVGDGPGPYLPGDQITLFANEYLRVWAVEEWQAASSARSRYDIEDVDAP